MLNDNVFKDVSSTSKKILVVTKYWNETKTKDIIYTCEKNYLDVFYWVWENRIENIIEKNLPREKVHFIWNIQSKKISKIVKHCSTIHSLSSLEHAKKIDLLEREVFAFIQICLDSKKNIGINPIELPKFLENCKDFKYLKIIGISGMLTGEFNLDEKIEEFRKLISLRDKYLPYGIISAWTSRDYKIALLEWIDVVRVGKLIDKI